MLQLKGQFPPAATSGSNANIQDLPSSGWSQGRMTIFPLSAQATLAKPWTILGWGIHGRGTIITNSPALGPAYGRLGKILGGVLVAGSFTPQANAAFVQPPGEVLQNIAQIWDGSTDAPFQSFTGGPAAAAASTGYFETSQPLAQPQQLLAGEQLALGIWLTPSLVSAGVAAINLYGLGYTITYSA